MFKNDQIVPILTMIFKGLILSFLFSLNVFAEEKNYGSVCLGPNLSKVQEKTWVQVNSSEKFENPSHGKVKLILNKLDFSKSHKVRVFAKSSFTNEKIIETASWSFKFKNNGTKMVSIFRSAGGWQLFQNKISKCEFPITGCDFKYICK